MWFLLFEIWYRPSDVVLQPVVAGVFVLACLVTHEVLHIAAIRAIAPAVQVRVGVRGINPYVRIEGDMTLVTRLTFLLTPLVTISLLSWAISTLVPATGATCVIVAVVNAAGSVSDLWRAASLVRVLLNRDADSPTA